MRKLFYPKWWLKVAGSSTSLSLSIQPLKAPYIFYHPLFRFYFVLCVSTCMSVEFRHVLDHPHIFILYLMYIYI